MAEGVTADRFIYSRLAADSTLLALGIYDEDSVPPTASYPNIQFRAVTPGNDRFAIGDHRILVNRQYIVVAVARFEQLPPNYTSLEDYADRIDAQLHGASGTVGMHGQVFRSYRTEIYQRPQDYNGVQYRELGGRYTVLVQDGS